MGTRAALEETEKPFKKGDISTEPRYGTAQHGEVLTKSLRPDTERDSKAERAWHTVGSSEAVVGKVSLKLHLGLQVCVSVLCEQLGTIRAFIPVVYQRDF